MNLGFYIILAAQFFSALADNALLFAAIALLMELNSPDWHTPVLQQAFIFSYIVLAPFVGAFADSLPKGRVMFISNIIKLTGCLLMLLGVQPLLAYCLVGLGAAAYSPAKYGILTEYLPHNQLVKANSWMEGLTVAAIVLGALVGGILITPSATAPLLQALHLPLINSIPELAILFIALIYILAAVFNLYIPTVNIDHRPLSNNPVFLLSEFWHNFKLLWKDPLGQVSLGVTTLFWGAGATLRLLLIGWAAVALHYDIGTAAKLTAWFAVGIAIGSVLAARYVKLEHSIKVLRVGIAMGLAVLLMIPITNSTLAIALLIAMGAMGGYFVVPMNALLQHRGHLLMGAGSSIAVQNFNENLSIFAMLGLYALMQKLHISIYLIILVFGLLLSGIMTLLYKRHRYVQDDGKI
ncbi:MAG: lysophospholipid transporter LplT [Gallionellales bacterium CG_4_10_14_3_um_filter_54_96]|nr:MAG: lysophospholipid transporter LplT [Gallionellaceae bacterium CG1_02_56_997]PIX05492.1 MAG: lysophospholipid transporter LplT [Gallionellales bacterium CG_4_8_14_3_um_filter_54_18]PIY04622.1 MAG: lysophospholipid transporter LplT [Gallionellales bacterium CG_4_10_14_3_um_filter_54_96]PJC04461.1 MAG: lysophospholipid transporter LplT [Gallionellales bacterium CG_4_9_14_0_8_um_filter_55_61]